MISFKFRSISLLLCIGLGLTVAGCGYLNLGRGGTDEMPQASPGTTEPGNDASLSDREQAGDMIEPDSGSAIPDADSAPSTYVPAGTGSGGDAALAYRVQVYSFIDLDAAEAARDRVERYLADWSHRVYLEEEGGNYKIRVGDFTDKADADLLRDRLRREGYPDAWTVPIR